MTALADIVIPLGRGSRWNNTELRYALRGVEKHLFGVGRVFIIGERPDWLQNVIHIPAKDDEKTFWKERNIFRKILLACADSRVSENFLFMNDDHFLLKDEETGNFPSYYFGVLSEQAERTDQYGNTAKNTLSELRRDCNYFDIHCPIGFWKYAFLEKVGKLDWEKKYGYCIKTAYHHNMPAIFHTEQSDLKISNEDFTYTKIKELITGRPWFSIADRCRQSGMKQVLQELYSKKSKYEK